MRGDPEAAALVLENRPDAGAKAPAEGAEKAEKMRAAIFDADVLEDPVVIDQIRSLEPDVGVSVFFGTMLKKSLLDLFPRGSDEAFDLGRRQQSNILCAKCRLGAIHDHDSRDEGIFGDAPSQERKVHGLLHVTGEQQEAAGIGAEVRRVVSAAGRTAMRRCRAGA